MQAPCSTKNFTMAKLLHEAAQCSGVLFDNKKTTKENQKKNSRQLSLVTEAD